MSDRRQFLKQSAIVSLTPWVPTFLRQSVQAADAKVDDRILVVVQLTGGNDGLNTVVPFKHELYPKLRPTLRIDKDEVLRIDDEIGFHPAMKPAADLLQDGRLSVIQGVGYPNPNRSHFESMAIWHHGQLDSTRHDSIGWLGRAMDVRPSSEPDSIFVGKSETPVAIRGRRSIAASMARASDLELSMQLSDVPIAADTDSLASFVSRSLDDSFRAAKRFSESKLPDSEDNSYPRAELGQQLKLVSRLIKLGGATRVFYVSQPGYDTHSAQPRQHRRLLDNLSESLRSFLDDMQASKLEDRVVMMCFSEFGRRVKENASLGTDHGAAGPVFLAGSPVKSGIIGAHPSLSELANGDLKHSIDFRSIYATVLQEWLGIEAERVLGGEFKPIDCLNA